MGQLDLNLYSPTAVLARDGAEVAVALVEVQLRAAARVVARHLGGAGVAAVAWRYKLHLKANFETPRFSLYSFKG
jgi:hypothetical protein